MQTLQHIVLIYLLINVLCKLTISEVHLTLFSSCGLYGQIFCKNLVQRNWKLINS